ncbi:MAG: hypothetical protein Q7T73_04325 [Beijerinckiaceae bacterium]|nr:hypothetical protein [Beijerinckiaceae bacterium]
MAEFPLSSRTKDLLRSARFSEAELLIANTKTPIFAEYYFAKV